MTLLGRPPREMYRVYTEEEFFAAEDWPVEAEPDVAPVAAGEPKPWGRVAGLAALAAVVTAVVGVVAMNATRSRTGTERRFASRKTAPGRPPGAAAVARGATRPIGRDMRRHGRARPAVKHDAVRPPAAVIPSQPPPAATVAVSAPATIVAPRTATASTATVASGVATATAASSAPTATTASTGGARSEFGFER